MMVIVIVMRMLEMISDWYCSMMNCMLFSGFLIMKGLSMYVIFDYNGFDLIM